MTEHWVNRCKAAFAQLENRVLLIISLAGLLVRLPGIGYSFYGDEHFSLLRDSTYFYTPTEDRFRPIFFSLLYLWRLMGFQSEIGLRLLPLLFGVAQIPAAFFVGRRLGGERLARVFAVVIAASPMLIEFSQELRMYSMVATLALLQALTYLRLMERPNFARWTMFVVIGLLGVYTHLHYWIFLAGFALLFPIERRAMPLWKGWGSLTTVLILYLPNIPNIQAFAQRRGGDYIVHLPSALPKLFAGFTLGFNYIEFESNVAGRPVGLHDALRNLPVMLLAAIPAAIILGTLIRMHRKKPFSRTLLFGHALFTIPILLAFVACAVTKQYWLQPKYVIFSAPFALLFIADAFVALSPVWLRRTTLALGAAVCIIALIHFWTPSQYGRREDWRGAAQTLRSRLKPDAAFVLLGKPYSYGLLNYYWPEVRENWKFVEMPKPFTLSNGQTSSVSRSVCEQELHDQAHLQPGQDVYYLWSDIRKNEFDPNDQLLRAVIEIGGGKSEVIQLNPRLKLYHVKIPHLSMIM